MEGFDLGGWLARTGAVHAAPSPAALAALQEAQMRTVPFETFDPFLGTTPDLSGPAIFDKTVTRRRGGYCFELNGLFGAALVALGYDVRRALGRVRNGAAQGGARSHLALQVTLGGIRYLADAGFGGHTPLVPLEIDRDGEQQAPNGLYRITEDPVSGEKVVERRTGGEWTSLYGFDDAWVGETELAAANWLCANWPMTVFPNHLMLAGHDGDTRIGVFDRTVTLTGPQGQTREDLADHAAFSALVRGRLGLDIPDDLLDRAWARIAAA